MFLSVRREDFKIVVDKSSPDISWPQTYISVLMIMRVFVLVTSLFQASVCFVSLCLWLMLLGNYK
jgi:hypothetical protein